MQHAPLWLALVSLTACAFTACAFTACAAPGYDAVLTPGPQAPAADASLRGLVLLDDGVAWAVGSGGTIVRSLDGGASWQRVPAPPAAAERDLRDVHASSADTALVMAVDSPARIWRTTDGGGRWTLVLDDARDGAFLDAMDVQPDGFGIAWGDPVGGAFLAYRTTDGGQSWAPLDGLPRPAPGEAGFAASGTCVVCAGGRVWIGTGGAAAARVFRSPDRGRSWLVIDTPLPAGRPSAGVFSLALLDDGGAVVVGGDHLRPRDARKSAAFTTNSGLTWIPSPAPPAGYRSCVAAARGGLLVACGPTGVDVSHDAGQTWAPLASTGYHSVAIAPDGGSGLLVGPEGRTARLTVSPAR